jgi:hypothetical protein
MLKNNIREKKWLVVAILAIKDIKFGVQILHLTMGVEQ